MLTFDNLTRENWLKYKEHILSTELIFPEAIRTPEDEYIHILRARKTVLSVVGHFRQNSSLNIIKKFGAREIEVCKNWEDTGEDYVLCELEIY